MVVFPNIKINLGLYLTEKRSDGYHNLLSCFYPVNWCDILEIVPSENFDFIQTGILIPGKEEDNLCVKAYHFLRERYSIPAVRIHLHKIIPTGTGLGGGSSDASFTLKTLNTLLKLDLDVTELESIAAVLGSDCPFFIQNKPMIGISRGEVLEATNLDLKGTFIVIVCPEIHISTAKAFSGVSPKTFSGNFREVLGNLDSWKDHLYNQFEDTVFPLNNTLVNIKHELYEKGAFYASMSGSGSAIFGLFKNKPEFVSDYLTYHGVL